MTLLTWDKRYSIGITPVDHEHRELIYLINQVYAELGEGADGEMVDAMLGGIHNSVAAHFALEERFMLSSGYEEYHAHKADHEELLDQIRGLMDHYAEDPEAGRDLLKKRLSSWFGDHFAGFDARLHKKLIPHPS
jgi:hemerythrin